MQTTLAEPLIHRCFSVLASPRYDADGAFNGVDRVRILQKFNRDAIHGQKTTTEISSTLG